ncbi:MAG: HAD family hydrolase [Planctomycetes bacterium]|nr:HAD family hydrolase [Planctomycetota bacterium]
MSDKAIFLDRDNTLIEDPGYINNPDQVKLLPKATEAIIQLRKMGYKIVVISNQSGVARGILTEEVLAEIHQKMLDLLQSENGYVDRIYYCPYHPDGVIEKYRKESDMRKPGAGMLFLAEKEMDVDLANSWMVGDSYRDVAAGKKAGCKTILINSPRHPAKRQKGDPEPDKIAVNVKEAANIIKMCDQHAAKSVETESTETSQAKPDDDQSDKDSIKHLRTFHRPAVKQAALSEEIPKEDEVSKNEPTHPKTASNGKIEMLLQDIVNKLNRIDRSEMFEESSLWNVTAVAIQILAFACLLISIWFLIDQTRNFESVLTSIGYAVALQMIVISICIVKRHK